MTKVKIKVPSRSGFDKSFKNLLTAKVGTLVPILVDELIPNTKVSLKSAMQACMPPLATDAFMRVNLKVEAFFVPTRLLYGGYEQWLTNEPIRVAGSQTTYKPLIPLLKISGTAGSQPIGAGTLMDYLGFKMYAAPATSQDYYFNIFPLLAYHRIYDDMYRNANIQRPVFERPRSAAGTLNVYNLPYFVLDSQITTPTAYTLGATLADGITLGQLRQRNFGYDYFTNALPQAQRGNAQKVTIDTTDNTFTISALRSANSLQQFAERNQLAGPRLQDFVKANYGADLSNGVAQRTIYLGSGELPVYNKGVYQSNMSAAPISVTGNPFTSVAAKYGDAQATGELNLVNDFVANEPGYLMVLASLVPVVTYSNGIDRMFFRYDGQDSQVDMANPLLQNVGNQPIYAGELNGMPDKSVFGYTDRFADFKHKEDELHGLMRTGNSLQAFALQRLVTGNPQISSAFLEIPTAYMDQVTAVAADLSNYGYWLDVFHNYKVSMPLAEYSIPSLQDPAYEHGKDVSVDLNGSKIA